MKHSKLAIVILGDQNSGKTTTIHHFDKIYDEHERDKKQCKKGWRHLQIFKEKLGSLYVSIYFVPASPTETNSPLRKRFEDFIPEIIIVAEQKNGAEYQNTIDFLEDNGFEIKIFEIKEDNNNVIWSKWNNNNKQDILTKRSIEICNRIREFIFNQCLIQSQ